MSMNITNFGGLRSFRAYNDSWFIIASWRDKSLRQAMPVRFGFETTFMINQIKLELMFCKCALFIEAGKRFGADK